MHKGAPPWQVGGANEAAGMQDGHLAETPAEGAEEEEAASTKQLQPLIRSERWWSCNRRIIFLELLILLLTAIPLPSSNATHISGQFQTEDFFQFLVKFGFNKADPTRRNAFGYIYGNITSPDKYGVPLTLVVLDRSTFLEFYGNRSQRSREAACTGMFSRLQRIAYDSTCNPRAKRDFLRHVPCPVNQLCSDEDAPGNVVPGSQFTYVINLEAEPRWVHCVLSVNVIMKIELDIYFTLS